MRIRQKVSLFHYFHIVAFLIFFTCAIVFFIVSFYNAKKTFERESARLQENYVETQKAMLISQVNKFLDYVIEERNQAYAQTQKLVKARVIRAHELASQIYEQYKNTHDEAFIKARIVETLRFLRYDNGYYFISNMSGTQILHPVIPALEGKNLLLSPDQKIYSVINQFISIINANKEGYSDYSWSKDENNDNRKISYLKLFEPYGWIIGTGIYLEDIEHELKDEITSNEQRLIFDKESGNYIFIGAWNGDSVVGPNKGKNGLFMQDKNGKFLVQELIQKSKDGGGFVEYVTPDTMQDKLSYVVPIHEWQWYVGSGIYMKNVNNEITKLRQKMSKDIKDIFYSIAIWFVLFSIFVGIAYAFISRRIGKDFKLFIDFFDSLVNKDQFIDATQIRFLEFEELANHANAMLKSKISSNRHLEQYKKIVSSSDDFLALIDRNYTYLAISEAYHKFFDKNKEEILFHSMPDMHGEQYFVEELKHLSDRVLSGESFEHEMWIRSPHYGKRFLHIKYFPYYENEDDDMPIAYVVSARDNTEKKASEDKLIASEKKLDFLAHNDALTGLPNRLLLSDRLSHAIENCKRRDSLVAVCFIDLDNFKKINDSYGHSYGDEILKQFAARVQHIIRTCDTLSRIGGDEFILLVENLREKHEIEIIIAKIKAIFEMPFINKEQKFFLSASIGISVYPDHGVDGETLIKNADTAMYRAKDMGKNTHAFYTQDMTVASYERIGLENALREAIKDEQFVVYYQPQIHLTTRELIGLEALVRWNHPIEGILPPGRFITLAEETHLIVEIGAWILKQACIDVIELYQERLFNGTISINVSGVQIEFSDFLKTLHSVIEETSIHPSILEIEVTESFIMHNPERWIMLLKQMQELGLKIAIDDFGTGYSSLSYLRKLPINKLKVDMSFVKDIPMQEDACAIVDSIINLAKNMKLTTLAEGIEHDAQEHYLASHGCEQGQGYLYAKPMSLNDLKTWIQNRS